MLRKVYVMGSYVPNGGTYMAHTIGEIFHAHFGFEFLSVEMPGIVPTDTFPYRQIVPSVSVERMLSEAGSNDVVVVNPSFSDLAIGLRTAARTLSYVQGFNTFPLLDRFMTGYVSVSSFVAGFLQTVYDLRTPVIPAFANGPIGAVPSWDERPSDLVLVSNKAVTNLNATISTEVLGRLRGEFPTLRFEPLVTGPMKQQDVHQRLAGVRYLLTLSLTEGFGLLPLEAMAHGTLVIGFDGFGGREYMRSNENCLAVPYPDIGSLQAAVRRALSDPAAQRLAEAGPSTAERYGLQQFESRWVDYIRYFLSN